MSGVLGIVFTIVFFYIDSTLQKSVFLILGIVALVFASYKAWRNIDSITESPIELEVDFHRSWIHIQDRKSHPDEEVGGRVFQTIESIRIEVWLKFVNKSNNTVLISGVDALVRRNRRFRRSEQTGTWNTAVGQSIGNIQKTGLSVPGPSKSDYQLLRWAIGITDNPREAFVDSDYTLVLTIHILGQQDHKAEFDVVWEDDDWAKLRAK